MLSITLISLQVRLAIVANRLINFLSRIPLIKRVIHAGLYGSQTAKTVFTVLGLAIIVPRRIFARLFYALTLVGIGFLLYHAEFQGGYRELYAMITSDDIIMEYAPNDIAAIIPFALSGWFFLSFVGSFAGASIVDTRGHDNNYAMIFQLRANPSLFAKSRVALAIVLDILQYLPLVLVAFLAARIPLWCVFPLFVMFAAFRLLGETINLLMFRYTRRHLGLAPYSFVSILALGAAFYVPVYYGAIDWAGLLSNPLVPLVSAAAGAAMWLYIRKYPLYGRFLRDKLTLIASTINKIKSQNKGGAFAASLSDAAKWHKSIDEKSLGSDRHSGKNGFAYLNAVFFDRHSAFFKKKMLLRLGFLLSPLALSAAATVYGYTQSPEGYTFFSGRDIPFQFAPLFFFVMYSASMGRVVTASVFANCDIQMLHYAYYRTFETTAASFKSRFAMILLSNTIIALVLSVSILGTAYLLFGYMDYQYAAIFTLLLMMIGLFFAFNDLFLYYVIQPYDSTGHNKSIAYNVINIVIYIFSYINLQIRLELVGYCVFIAILTALYLGLGLALLYRLAPKKFRLR